MASLAPRREIPTPNDLHTPFPSLPWSIRSSHLFLLAFAVLLVSTLEAILPYNSAASLSYPKPPAHLVAQVAQDRFVSLATPVLDSIDSISSPAVITSCSLILVGTLVRGAENTLLLLGFKGRC